jgi:Na+/citrate or Na+/malate symporter
MRFALVGAACLSFLVGAYLGRHDPQAQQLEVTRPLVVAGCGGAGVLNQSR